MKSLAAAVTVFALHAPVHAERFVVDQNLGPGTDFVDVVSAVASPLVTDGDILLIRPGKYDEFMTSKSLTYQGLGTAARQVQIRSQSGLTTVIANCSGQVRMDNLAFGDLMLLDCSAPVFLTNLSVTLLDVFGVADLRVERLGLETPKLRGRVAIRGGTHAELTYCRIGPGSSSTVGLAIRTGSVARVSLSTIIGGRGFPSVGVNGGDGGEAVFVDRTSELQLVGGLGSLLKGGQGGMAPTPAMEGNGGPAIRTETGASIRYSGYELQGGESPSGVPGPLLDLAPGTVVTVGPYDDPALQRERPFAPGHTTEVNAYGIPGAMAVFLLGTDPVFVSVPGVIGTQLVGNPTTVGMLLLDQNGTASLPFVTPATAIPDVLMILQASVFYPDDGSTRFTNTLHVVVPYKD